MRLCLYFFCSFLFRFNFTTIKTNLDKDKYKVLLSLFFSLSFCYFCSNNNYFIEQDAPDCIVRYLLSVGNGGGAAGAVDDCDDSPAKGIN